MVYCCCCIVHVIRMSRIRYVLLSAVLYLYICRLRVYIQKLVYDETGVILVTAVLMSARTERITRMVEYEYCCTEGNRLFCVCVFSSPP